MIEAIDYKICLLFFLFVFNFGLSVEGLAAMGVAIPAFFGGLMIGNKALGLAENYDGFDFDFTNIKKAATGFSGIIKELDFVTLPCDSTDQSGTVCQQMESVHFKANVVTPDARGSKFPFIPL